ncbi:MAG TPA: L,D-transpeptidase, partial [Polyangiaceae bacterium]
ALRRPSRFMSYLGRMIPAVSAAGLLVSSTLSAQPSPTRSIGDSAQPLQVTVSELPIYVAPAVDALRRGTLARGAQVLVHERARGAGCQGDWVLVGAAAWACDDSRSFGPSSAAEATTSAADASHEYARISVSGALGYKSIAQAEAQLPDAELQPGFFVSIVEHRVIDGELYLRTTHDIWLARRDVVLVQPSAFEGVEIDEATATLPMPPVTASSRAAIGVDATNGQRRAAADTAAPAIERALLPLGWTYVDRAVPRRSPDGPAVPRATLGRHSRVQVLETRRHRDQRLWYRTNEGWFSERELRVPLLTLPPDGIGERERWLDIDRRRQTLVAYVGETPVFATLVSTGRGIDVGSSATPPGSYRIWVKLTMTDMDNLEEVNQTTAEDAKEPYAVEAVPFVMFFHRGVGLHATYWHDGFGTPKSHGCVNLSLRDAERIFDFTGPRLPKGWQAAHPYAYDPGTLVRVR